MPEEEPCGGLIAVGVLRPSVMLHREMSAKGGKSRSSLKRQAALRNLAKAQAVQAEKRKALGRGLASLAQAAKWGECRVIRLEIEVICCITADARLQSISSVSNVSLNET
jgi:hypothetical protein